MFLETHGQDQVLTVLADGDLETSLPEALLEYEKEVNGIMKKTAVESLAADIRGQSDRERNKKLNTEIYRLLAPMLGCGFDDLVMRQRAYRQQQRFRVVSAAFLASLVVLGIIGRQAVVIQKNYRDALKRESVGLAEQSGDALSGGDRLEAVKLAVSALPDDPDKNLQSQRPVTAQAKADLIRSMGFYQGNHHGWQSLAPYCLLEMEYGSNDYENFVDGPEQINEDESCLVSADDKGTIYVWNLSDGELLQRWDRDAVLSVCGGTVEGRGKILCLAFEQEYTILIITDSAILEGNALTGQLILRATIPEVYLADNMVQYP